MWCCRRMEKIISWTNSGRRDKGLHRVKEERNILHTIKKRKAYWFGHVSRSNYFLKLVIERNIAGRIEVMGGRGRRRKQLLDDLNP